MRTSTLLALAATALIALAGCGSSSSSKTTTSSAANSSAGGAYGHGGTATTAAAAASTTGTATTQAGPTVAIVTKSSKLGPVLAAGTKRMTVYLFEKDTGTMPTCTGACAAAWPPVIVTSAPTASHGAVAADLGTTTRADGTKQVTYKGHPLYFFSKDGDAGDAYGQGVNAFGASWYVLKPSGEKVDES